MTDLLLDTALTPEQTTYVKAARTSGETLLSLIDEILDFSKIEAGKLDLDARPFSLASLVEETVELLAPRAQAKGIEIASFVDERLPARLIGDAARLRQVVLNLAGNAIKFTERGGVAVMVEPGKREKCIRLCVRDTGIGIAPGDCARIFGDFEQADGSATRKFGGTGLGLAISKRIVERMGGAISVESTPGAGSTFSIDLPLAPATAADVSFVAPDLTGRIILMVASAEIEASLIARRLVRWGAKVCTAADESVAAALLPERAWDAVLVDCPLAVRMTGRAGFATVPRRVALIRPTDRAEWLALNDAGYTGYLVKPVRAASLAARLTAQGPFEQAVADATDEALAPVQPATSKGLSVLVAEDNEINALLVRALLGRLGHRPTVAENGAAALDAWHAARAGGMPYDLVLMDVQMPVMDGLEATRRMRAAETELGLKPCAIVALTATAGADDREAAVAAGMNDVLVKPLDRERLLNALERIAAKAAPLAA
jgi:CheY-like chemotaxis protein/anti-sigma regulatory factor (Ser/Thr protein kinase)